ncbi:Signal recognition particle subunit SRP68 [Chionoecetes opilio]|uniref:Signal recognition particle subunit SRP68 n=1 Tax=Chionoecetes opilio TaxID=41210 RepID=A0A8J4Y225_CHIOP|nr:Signal recognition particle subunit SRP68 [Chionoecetes opilio]
MADLHPPAAAWLPHKFLYIPLVTVERYWAYAMQLKEESQQDPRKKFSMRNKLRKAATYVSAFERLVEESEQCDARTQLEVQGYSAWLQGTVLFELAEWTGQWTRPVEYFNKALAIYTKLQGAVSEEETEVYSAKIQEVEVKLRFCRHHLGDRSATDTLLAMHGNEALGDKLDNLLASAREHQASTLSEVTWKGRTLAVKHEKVRLFLLNEGLIHEELARTAEADERVRRLDRLLMECKDAIQLVRDDLKADAVRRLGSWADGRQHCHLGSATAVLMRLGRWASTLPPRVCYCSVDEAGQMGVNTAT